MRKYSTPIQIDRLLISQTVPYNSMELDNLPQFTIWSAIICIVSIHARQLISVDAMPLHGKHHDLAIPFPVAISIFIDSYYISISTVSFVCSCIFLCFECYFFGYARPVNFRFSPLNSPENWCAKTKAIAQIEENNRYDDG